MSSSASASTSNDHSPESGGSATVKDTVLQSSSNNSGRSGKGWQPEPEWDFNAPFDISSDPGDVYESVDGTSGFMAVSRDPSTGADIYDVDMQRVELRHGLTSSTMNYEQLVKGAESDLELRYLAEQFFDVEVDPSRASPAKVTEGTSTSDSPVQWSNKRIFVRRGSKTTRADIKYEYRVSADPDTKELHFAVSRRKDDGTSEWLPDSIRAELDELAKDYKGIQLVCDDFDEYQESELGSRNIARRFFRT